MTTLAEISERSPGGPLRAQPGREDLAGFAVVGQPFASGDVLCLRVWPGSTFGPGYVSVWHRTAAGEWTVYTSVPPAESCPRFVGAAIAHAIQTPIEVEWTGPERLEVRIPAVDLRWELQMASTPVTRMMNLMMALMPAALYRSNLVLAMMSLLATVFLAAGRFRMNGRLPNRQWFQVAPRQLWMIPNARAVLAGRDFGAPRPLPTQPTIGELPLPQRGVFMVGGMSVEAFDPARHLPAPRAEAPRPTLAVGAA
jgi:hypothetical protein